MKPRHTTEMSTASGGQAEAAEDERVHGIEGIDGIVNPDKPTRVSAT